MEIDLNFLWILFNGNWLSSCKAFLIGWINWLISSWSFSLSPFVFDVSKLQKEVFFELVWSIQFNCKVPEELGVNLTKLFDILFKIELRDWRQFELIKLSSCAEEGYEVENVNEKYH